MCLWQVPFSFLLSFSFSSDHPFCPGEFSKMLSESRARCVDSERSVNSFLLAILSLGQVDCSQESKTTPRGTRDVLPMDRPPLACVCDTLQQLQIENAMASFYASGKPGRASSCKGKLAFLQSTDHSVSHSNPKSGKTF